MEEKYPEEVEVILGEKFTREIPKIHWNYHSDIHFEYSPLYFEWIDTCFHLLAKAQNSPRLIFENCEIRLAKLERPYINDHIYTMTMNGGVVFKDCVFVKAPEEK